MERAQALIELTEPRRRLRQREHVGLQAARVTVGEVEEKYKKILAVEQAKGMLRPITTSISP
jgi:hypothetical protein